MATFTGTGVSSVTSPIVNGNTTIVLTNTSSFIGTVFLETSLDGGETWPTPAQALTAGTMVAGPLTFNVTSPQLTGGSYQTAQHRLHCTAYTSGTLTYTVTEAAVPAATGGPILGTPSTTGQVVGSFASLIGSSTNDSAPVGMIGEYQSTQMTQAAALATGTALSVQPPVATPALFTVASATGLANLSACTFTNSGGGLPTGVSAATNYYICNLNPTAGTFNVASTLALAAAGTPDINISVIGTGTQSVHNCATLVSTTAADICGLALTAGDWDVDAIVFPGYGASTSVTSWALWIAQVGASAQPTTAAAVLGQALTASPVATANTTNTAAAWTTAGTLRVSLAAAGYLALATQATFSVSTLSPQALLRARRVR